MLLNQVRHIDDEDFVLDAEEDFVLDAELNEIIGAFERGVRELS